MLYTLVLVLLLSNETLVVTEVPGFETKEACIESAKLTQARIRGAKIVDAQANCVGKHHA